MAATTTTTLTRSESEGVTVLRLAGPLTHDTVPLVRPAFEAATDGAARVVVNLTDVPILTTPGLSLLLTASRRLTEAGGRLVLTGTRGIVDDMLRRCRLDVVLDIVPDAAEATRRAREGGAQNGAAVG
jgi:anti-anti-sigma factor